MRKLFILCGFLATALLFSQSDTLLVKQYVDEGMAAIERGEYEQALHFFTLAQELDGENPTVNDNIESLIRIVSLEDYTSDKESIDAFLKERDNENRNSSQEEDIPEEDLGYIAREHNREQARQERSIVEATLFSPLVTSSTGTLGSEEAIEQEDLLSSLGFEVSYFPDVFKRTIGLELDYSSYSIEVDDELILYNETKLGLAIRNYFNEQPGSYSFIGTNFSAGIILQENTSSLNQQLINFWQFDVFLHDPLFYRLIKSNITKNIAFEGDFKFSLLNDTYMLIYGGGLHISLNKVKLIVDFHYRSLYEDDIFYPSWVASTGFLIPFR